MRNLVDVFRTSYSGTGTHPRLLSHAKDELKSIANKFYDICRLLFPELPAEHSARRVNNSVGITHSPSSFSPPNYNAGFTSAGDSDGDIMLVESSCPKDVNRSSTSEQSAFFEESEVISPTLLVFLMLIPKVYEPLFHLYVLYNEKEDEQYWSRIQRFNKQSDLTLLSYLGVHRKFWFISNGETLNPNELALGDRDKCYTDAIEMLQRLSTCLTPAEKLGTIRLTFDKINKMVEENLPSDFVWSMDDLFPVFLFVVIRSRLRYLGSELHYMEDLMDSHLEHGELGLMFTTLKACHMQIQMENII